MKWLYRSIRDRDAAMQAFDDYGFCGFTNLLETEVLQRIHNAVDESVESGRLVIGSEEMANNNDCIYAHEEIKALCNNKLLVDFTKNLLKQNVELQHAKFNAKPKSSVSGIVNWHQDYPFFPHTNFDLAAAVIHLDDTIEQSGPMEFIPGSHKRGLCSHVSPEGQFAYEVTDQGNFDTDAEPVKVLVPKGSVTFHHCLTIHRSLPKTSQSERRLLVFQYRAVDAVQLAGVLWRCTGYQVEPNARHSNIARFPCGTSVSLRGNGGRLYDLFGTLAPDKVGY